MSKCVASKTEKKTTVTKVVKTNIKKTAKKHLNNEGRNHSVNNAKLSVQVIQQQR